MVGKPYPVSVTHNPYVKMRPEHISPKQFLPCPTTEAYAESGRKSCQRLLEGLERYASGKHGRACDYGAGDGRVARYMAPAFEELTCVELTPALLACTKRTLKAHRNVHYCLSEDFPGTERFDFIYAMQVLQHNPYARQIEIVKAIKKALSDTGLGCIHLPNKARTDVANVADSATCMRFSAEMAVEIASYFSYYFLEGGYTTNYYLWVWR